MSPLEAAAWLAPLGIEFDPEAATVTPIDPGGSVFESAADARLFLVELAEGRGALVEAAQVALGATIRRQIEEC